jgi:hypothetical protein
VSSLAGELAAQLPDPGAPEFPAVIAVLAGFVSAGFERFRGGSWKAAEEAAFRGGFWGTGAGLIAYLAALMADLY